MPPVNYVAFTAPINPSGASPILTRSQIWSCLEIKITSGETFVGAAIKNTAVLKTGTTDGGQTYTDREVTFAEGDRKVKEHCIAFPPMKVEFHQDNGTRVMNILSQGAGGEEDLYMTYTFEWLHPELEGDEKGLAEKGKAEQAMSRKAVESTIEVMRRLVSEGKGEMKSLRFGDRHTPCPMNKSWHTPPSHVLLGLDFTSSRPLASFQGVWPFKYLS